MKQIVIACGSMPFGPNTLQQKSLGGSETAALMLAKSLQKQGHKVIMFCNLPAPGEPDHFAGGLGDDGVIYAPLQVYAEYVALTEHDLTIIVRDPSLAALNAQSRKKVLWMHDVATKRTMQRALDEMGWTIDEIWTVSEWHRKQVAEVTGYNIDNIFALRNGIVPVETFAGMAREEKTLIYASRPERGLENLIRPGGVMEKLPEYRLVVAMYDHFPEHMRQYYESIFARMNEMPNVEFVGSKPQAELRAMIGTAAAYIYPTQFEETSCILARECIEQKTPFLTTRVGALPETLGDCGIFFDDWLHLGEMPPKGSPEWCSLFAAFVRETMQRPALLAEKVLAMSDRSDLYWDGVADMVIARAEPKETKLFSIAWSLIQDGDVIPARELLLRSTGKITGPLIDLEEEIREQYSFIDGDMQTYYENAYVSKKDTPETELTFEPDRNSPRIKFIGDELSKLPPYSRVLEYGCGPGHLLAPLAKRFPLLEFVGVEISESAVKVVNDGAAKDKLMNLSAIHGDTSKEIPIAKDFDVVICSEVLEHVVEPWKLLQEVEAFAKSGGKIIITVPFGAWEPMGYERKDHWHERNHLWSIDQQMFRDMCGGKPDERFSVLTVGYDGFARPVGNLVYCYNADHRPILAIDAYAKALRHRARPTTAAAVIAYNNEDTILRMLNSLEGKVQFVRIALGPSTDMTEGYISDWFEDRPWMRYAIVDVPKIEPWKFGFDDARNVSVATLSNDFDWIIWIDTDEAISGDFRKYLRNSVLDGYLIPQHHFTCVPRGNPPEIDRPARLIRTSSPYKAMGHIHEHFELPEGGPGRCYMLPDVDIAHYGYLNEDVRQGRFKRNFPFLEWDHQTEGNDRKLHKFLWLRDIVHRMRFARIEGKQAEALKLANETIAYYNEFREEMATFGPGLTMALTYVSEAYDFLGIGIPMEITVKFEDRHATLKGKFESYEQLEGLIGQVLKPEFKDRLSRYW